MDMKEKKMHERLRRTIGANRYDHSIGVMDMSIDLAKHYGYAVEKAAIAGLLHDCGKLQDKKELLKQIRDFGIILDDVSKYNKELIHAPLGRELAKVEYDVDDLDILDAIRYHTTGRENMSLIEKIVYIADVIEPSRSFPGVEDMRDMAYDDIDRSILHSMNTSIKFLIGSGRLIHPDTIKARNQLLIMCNME